MQCVSEFIAVLKAIVLIFYLHSFSVLLGIDDILILQNSIMKYVKMVSF